MKSAYLTRTGNTPVIIHAPHGGSLVSQLAHETMTITDAELNAELLAMTDHYTDFMAREIAVKAYAKSEATLSAGIMTNSMSRLVVDPERFPDEREEMNVVGMGAVYTHGSQRQLIRSITDEQKEELLNAFFFPYAQAMQSAVNSKLKIYGKAVILDLHSYASQALPYELHSGSSRPEICVGYDEYHSTTSQIETISNTFTSAGYEVGFNSPFSGSYVPLRQYHTDSRVTSIMLEIRRDMYMDETTGWLDSDKYTRLLGPLIELVDHLNKTW